jgi:hypothetical protein
MSPRDPEFELILCCARREMDSPARERLQSLLQEPMDWPSVMKRAGHHGVIPLLTGNLKSALPGLVPAAVLEHFENYALAIAGHNLFLTHELVKILDLFQAHGIPAIPFKGPSLAWYAYGKLSSRTFADLDILVQRKDFSRAKGILLDLGYRGDFSLAPQQEERFLRTHHEYPMARKDGKVQVELQWGVTPRDFSFLFPLEPLWERLREIDFEGRKILAFTPEDLFLNLCLHGSEHCWERLIWVCDLAEMMGTHREMDWEGLVGRAKRLGCSRILLLGVFLARKLLEADLPEPVWNLCLADILLKRLAEEVEERLRSKEARSLSLFDRSRFYLKVSERRRDKFLFCLRLASTPTVEDWQALCLPPALSFLYYPLHPLRVLGKYGRMGWKNRKLFSRRAYRTAEHGFISGKNLKTKDLMGRG